MVNRKEDCNHLLTREEEVALGRMKPLVIRHLDLILETVILHLGSDPKAASLLQDAVAVNRLKQWQREYLLALFDGNRQKRSAAGGEEDVGYRNPLGLSLKWHLRMLGQVVTALQPLIHDAFESRPRLHRTIDSAMLNLVFHDIERLMAASVEQRGEWMEAAPKSEQEVKKPLNSTLSTHEAEEQGEISIQLKVMEELMLSHTMMCGMARKMNAPLNLILNSAEQILQHSADSKVQLAVMGIVRQVEVMIQLREPLRALGQRLACGLDAADDAGATDATFYESRPSGRMNMRLEDGN
ncbi:MAG TPA: protoglobin domain-containing protein [Nitrospira sp.]|nr:protoglobin domain-containing protein [Nitrospira sp.]